MTASYVPTLGIVIPTVNEAEHLPRLLSDIAGLSIPHEVVVVDGGSSDGTQERARAAGALVVRSQRGRATQMNAGAVALRTPWLLFLHADCRIPAAAREQLARWVVSRPPEASGHFRFQLSGEHWFWRFIEAGQALREGLFGLVYGDQGLLVSRETFLRTDGFPELPLLEDVEFVRRLRAHGSLERIEAPLPTSPRRYEIEGKWGRWLRNSAIIALHRMGVSAHRLVDWYPSPERAPPDLRGSPGSTPDARDDALDRERRTLAVFVKAPREGKVKTRLARDLGTREATRIYRSMGRKVVERVRAGPYRTVVYFDPPDAADQVRSWLDAAALELRPQPAGDLGERLAHAAHESLAESERVAIVGTDSPDLGPEGVEAAFRLLDEVDVVFGPAFDGGYYLIALRRYVPEVFQGIPWSTDRVLAASEARARAAGLRTGRLGPLRDVDTISDLDRIGRVRDGAGVSA